MREQDAIDIAEQRMVGNRVIFLQRWDHQLALKFLGNDRAHFELWARKNLEERKTTDPATRLVQRYLYRFSSKPISQMTAEQKDTYERGRAFLRAWMAGRNERELKAIAQKKLTKNQLEMLRQTSKRIGVITHGKDATLTLLEGRGLVKCVKEKDWYTKRAWTITSVGVLWLEHHGVKPFHKAEHVLVEEAGRRRTG